MTVSGSRASGDAVRRAGRTAGRVLTAPFAKTGRGIRKVTSAHGAGESGLNKLIELHAVNSAGDMLVTVALASTVFFSVPTDEARGRVALYLAITMAPFTLLAPVIGPLLDRLPHGRRAAMAAAMLARALLALMLGGAVVTGSLELYPAALGVLVASKAYGVVRSAVVPRLLPPRFSLVKANSRVTLGGLLATGLAAPLGAGLHQLGPRWPLYAAFSVFVVGTFLSFTLPHKVDSSKGEDKALLAADETHLHREHKKPGLRTVGPGVTHGLAANAGLRCLSGFLIFFLAFLLREDPFPGQSAAVSLGMVAVAAGIGNALGTAVGAALKGRAPELIIVTVVAAATGVAITAAVFFGAPLVAALGAVAGAAQALAKLALDAMIQRDVPEQVRNSAFARSETLLQMAWVVGGAIGIVLPLHGVLGFAVAAAIVGGAWLLTVRGLLGAARHGSAHPRVA
ncbi:MFS transporter [Streptomyces sp. TRM66268-LWL]|uniref:MFS transporter n=1 Tax=Streptomyces polyasparticus TaxID=2767826 RepID=A0ABR7SNB7_9ACTN|nr:MFS transporter [Streptomyces polyasparticus]